MEYAKGSIGRVYFARFDHGEDLLSEIKKIAEKEDLPAATILILGALEKGDIVTGPEKAEIPPDPHFVSFDDGREIIGFGTIIKQEGSPSVHLHSSYGRGDSSLTGCLRKGGKVFLTVEVLITEVKGIDVSRKKDEASKCNLIHFT